MSLSDLLAFTASRRTWAPPTVAPTSRRPTGEEIRAQLGPGATTDDLAHAVLVVREAPRLGARLTSEDDRLRRYLEAQRLRTRAPTGRIVFATDHFLMDSFSEPDSERFTPVYNFASPCVQSSSDSGRSPRLYQYQGSLLSAAVEGSAYAEFRAGWDDWLRATALVGGAARQAVPYVVELTYRDQLRRGYPTIVQFDRAANHPSRVGFGLSLFVVHESFRDTPPRRPPTSAEFRRQVAESPSVAPLPPAAVARLAPQDFLA